MLLLDELPYMLQKIAAEERRVGGSGTTALDMLDVFRAMRNKHENLRMIYAGSVGLHHILSSLRGTGIPSQPVNDMPSIEIGPLALEDACVLAAQLLKREDVEIPQVESEAFMNVLAEGTDRVPFYLERVIARLAELEQPVSMEQAESVVLEHLTGDQDPWEMEHFRARLRIYYPGTSSDANDNPIENREIAATILDFLAEEKEPQSIEEVWSGVKAKLSLANRDQIVELLRLLSLDHYLKTDAQKRYAFRFPLIRKWWGRAQGLSR